MRPRRKGDCCGWTETHRREEGGWWAGLRGRTTAYTHAQCCTSVQEIKTLFVQLIDTIHMPFVATAHGSLPSAEGHKAAIVIINVLQVYTAQHVTGQRCVWRGVSYFTKTILCMYVCNLISDAEL